MAPLYTDPVVGYRSWTLSPKGYVIYSRITRTRSWPPDQPAIAGCYPPEFFKKTKSYVEGPHESPHQDCGCGLYAFHDLSEALDQYGNGERCIVGAAVFWGEIYVHTLGFRAQYGRPVAFAEHRREGRAELLSWPTMLERLTERYNIPVVPLRDLRAYAETFGKPLGADYLDG